MIKNTVSVYIDGINRTDKLLASSTGSNVLDEVLDEGVIRLRYVKKAKFSPLLPVEIHVTNALIRKGKTVDTQETVYYYLIAGDSAEESPNGSGLYNHDIALVECTKLAECIVCDTQTVTNTLGRVYTDYAYLSEPVIDNDSNIINWGGWDDY